MERRTEYCNCCRNRNNQQGDLCSNCCVNDGKWSRMQNFEPTNETRKYFSRGWISDKDHDYFWNSTHKDLQPTKAIEISNSHYCPYCVSRMFPIQNNNLDVIGYTCLCDGAIAELEWKAEDKALRERHEKEIYELKEKYVSRVQSNLEALFELKQKKEKESFDFHHWNRTLFQMDSKNIIDVEDLII